MKIDWQILKTPTGHLLLIGLVLVGAGIGFRMQQRSRIAPPLPVAQATTPPALPKTFNREGAVFPKINPPVETATLLPASRPVSAPPRAAAPIPVLPLTLHWQPPTPPVAPGPIKAPYGRMIPCQTVVALESNRLDTPVIGLVTEDVWHDGRRVIPAGAEVHGRAAVDRTRERLAVQGSWKIVWRTPDADNGTELAVDGLALDREFDGASGRWGERDGSAGLRGEIVKTQDDRELKLFAATFLGAATAALQETRPTAGLLGESAVPVATVRSAALAGTSAILRDYAQQMKEAIARDGFYLRVPAGKPFYLYVTQTLDRPQRLAASAGPRQP